MLQARSVGISLSDILPHSRLYGSAAIRVDSCCHDSRHCQPGDLFAAIVGVDTDGHDHVQEAISRGASAILAERHLPVAVPTCIVKDSRAAFGRVCHALADDPSLELCTVGISGTHGKTITSLLLSAIFEAATVRVGILNSLGFCDGNEAIPHWESGHSPTELARRLASMRNHGCSHAVVETSSRDLALYRMEGVRLDAAILTNVRRANLDLHGSVWNYRQAEQRLFRGLKPDGFAVLNADDPGSGFGSAKLKRPVITFGIRQPAEVCGEIIESHLGEQTFLLSIGDECVPVRTRIMGSQHVSNCLAAAATATVMGIDIATIARGLESVATIPYRMESLAYGQDYAVLLDTRTTSDSLALQLKSLRSATRGRLICLLGVSENDSEQELPRFGRVLEKYADVGLITGENHSQKLSLEVAHGVLDGYDRPAVAHLIPDRERAIRWAMEMAKVGDTLYFVGRNHDRPNPSSHANLGKNDRLLVSATLEQAGPHILRFRQAA